MVEMKALAMLAMEAMLHFLLSQPLSLQSRF